MQKDIKQALKQGQVVMGPFVRISSPDLVEIFGEAGFDFIIIDQEHGPLSTETASNLVRACDLVGMAAIIRVPDNQPWMIQHALDIGALGVQVPQVGTAADMERVVRSAKFAPDGSRGVCRNVRAARYSARDRFKYFAESNRDTVVVVHIEGQEGVENLGKILQVPGLDVIFLGPYDLSQSLGLPGQVDHPKVQSTMEEVIRMCRRTGVAVGTFADNVEAARRWIDLGVQYMAIGVDTSLIYNLTHKLVADFHAGLPARAGT